MLLAEQEDKAFHCLTVEEWAKITSILTYSETKVLYYLLSQNPMGDRSIDCRVRTIAEVMKISVGSVSTALKQLEAKGLIESMQIVRAEITIKPLLMSKNAEDYVAKQKGKAVQPTEQQVQPTEHSHQPTEQQVQPTKHEHIYRSRARSKTLKTNSDLNTQERVQEKIENQEGRSSPESVVETPKLELVTKEPQIIDEDRGSAAPLAVIKNSLRTTTADIREMEMRLGGQLPAYRFARGPNGIRREFIEYIRQWLISIRNSDVLESDAKSYIVAREPGGCKQLYWSVLLDKASEWEQSISANLAPTKGQVLAADVALALNKAQIEVVDRFEKVGNCYQWEIAPGVPIPDILEWYAQTQISRSKRPELTGKSASILAAQDFRDRNLAASIYADYEKWAQTILTNSDRIYETKQSSDSCNPSQTTVEIKPIETDEEVLKSKIARLQGYLNGKVPLFVKRAIAEVEEDGELVIVNGIVEEAV